jgi:hypothetical protein
MKYYPVQYDLGHLEGEGVRPLRSITPMLCLQLGSLNDGWIATAKLQESN